MFFSCVRCNELCNFNETLVCSHCQLQYVYKPIYELPPGFANLLEMDRCYFNIQTGYVLMPQEYYLCLTSPKQHCN